MGSDNLTEIADHCFVSRYLSWTADSDELMEASRLATEDYFGQQGRRCLMSNSASLSSNEMVEQQQLYSEVMDLSLQVDDTFFNFLNNNE